MNFFLENDLDLEYRDAFVSALKYCDSVVTVVC